jgi:hypothetical protein
MFKKFGFAAGLVAAVFASSVSANGRVVVNNDEWTLSDNGFTSAGVANVNAFVANLKTYLNGSNVSGCSFLVISSNFGLTEASLSGQMAAAPACTWTVNAASPFTVPNLSSYDAVFLAGTIAGVATGADVAAVLTPYVAAGGSVYIAAGTGVGGPVDEAAYWNPFLNTLGIALDPNYSVTSPEADLITGTHPLLAGVTTLYFANGNAITAASPVFGSQIIETGTNGGQLAVYDRANDARLFPSPPVPTTPAAMLAALAALLAAAVALRKKSV